jgi:hypothetical protein
MTQHVAAVDHCCAHIHALSKKAWTIYRTTYKTKVEYYIYMIGLLGCHIGLRIARLPSLPESPSTYAYTLPLHTLDPPSNYAHTRSTPFPIRLALKLSAIFRCSLRRTCSSALPSACTRASHSCSCMAARAPPRPSTSLTCHTALGAGWRAPVMSTSAPTPADALARLTHWHKERRIH